MVAPRRFRTSHTIIRVARITLTDKVVLEARAFHHPHRACYSSKITTIQTGLDQTEGDHLMKMLTVMEPIIIWIV